MNSYLGETSLKELWSRCKDVFSLKSHDHNYAGSSSVGGVANSAVKLQTARNINGIPFDGTQNITTANWGSSRNIKIGNTSKVLNGSSDVAWSLSEIGALPSKGSAVDSKFQTSFRTQTKGDSAEGYYIGTLRTNSENVPACPQYSAGLAWGCSDTHSYINISHRIPEVYVGGGTADRLSWTRKLSFDDHTHEYLSLSGGVVNGKVRMLGGSYVHATSGSAGTNGYFHFARITINDSYQDAITSITMVRRNGAPCVLYIKFQNIVSYDPDITSFYYEGGRADFYIHKSTKSTWDLYLLKTEAYDQLTVLELWKSTHNGGITIDWMSDQVSTTPPGCISATVHVLDILGNSETTSRLKTPIKINNVSFDGSNDITIRSDVVVTRVLSGDLDSYNTEETCGEYYAPGSNTVANKPAGVDAFSFRVYRTADGFFAQEVTTANGEKCKKFIRAWGGGAWTVWDTMYTSKYKQPNIPSSGRETALTGTTNMRYSGMYISEVYNNGYPIPYGNVINVLGTVSTGSNQILLGWASSDGTPSSVWFRSKRDMANSPWSAWDRAYTQSFPQPSTATLSTPRTINGTNFDGSSNITTVNWGTSRTLTIGNTGKNVNGSSNVSWTLSEIGAAAANHDHGYAYVSAKPSGSGTMNTVSGYGNSMGMILLSTADSTVNPNAGTHWHHFINMSYSDLGGYNMWQTQIANKSGTTDLWVRSRAGGTVTTGTDWSAPWTRILTGSNYTNVITPESLGVLSLAGGIMSGTITSSKIAGTWLQANNGNVIINSTAEGGLFNMLAKINSQGGYFIHGCYQDAYNLYYTSKTTVNSGINSYSSAACLLNELGHTRFPNLVEIGDNNDIIQNNALKYQLVVGSKNITKHSLLSTTSQCAIVCGRDNNTKGHNYVGLLGNENSVDGEYSLVTGRRNSAGTGSVVGGSYNSGGIYSAVFGKANSTSGTGSFIAGENNSGEKDYCFTSGNQLLNWCTGGSVFGMYNSMSFHVMDDDPNGYFVIGNGSGGSARSNAFRITKSGTVFSKGAYNTSGADYAELFEWEDGNPKNEDRRGKFVCLNGEKISLANSIDDNILGIISGNPAMVGNNQSEVWGGMYLTDMYGNVIYTKQLVPAKTEVLCVNEEDPSTGEIVCIEKPVIVREEHYEMLPTVNPDYDPSVPYTPRHDRPEWGISGLFGQLIVEDDGTCVVGGYCTVSSGGTGTSASRQMIISEDLSTIKVVGWYVMKRIDSNHVLVFFK